MVNSLKTIVSSNSSNMFFFFSISPIVCVVVLLTILEPALANNKYNMLILYNLKYNIQYTEVWCLTANQACC